MRSSTCSSARSIGTYRAKTSWSRALPESRQRASWNARSCRYTAVTSPASAATSIEVSSDAELGERGRILPAGEQPRGPPLDRRAQPVDLAHVLGGQTHHERPATGLLLQQTFRSQELERLADRAAADVELLRDPRLHQVLALGEPAGQDLLADAIRGVLGEGTRSVERPKRGRARGVAHDPSSPANPKARPHRSTSWPAFVRAFGEL